MKTVLLTLILITTTIPTFAQPCATIVPPQITENNRKDFEAKLEAAKRDYEKDTLNADALIWYGRRTAYLGRYMEAIDIFSKGIQLHPKDARFYRHRGHRYITVRCFDKALADLSQAAYLIKGKPDEIEPDGLPNARNIPTSTLQSNTWYHLGLAYYLKSDYKNALKAYRECLKVSTNSDMYVATANWLYVTLRRLKKNKEATTLLSTINFNMDIIENKDYLEILVLYIQQSDFEDPVNYLVTEKSELGLASFGYGLGLYLLLNGDKANAKKVFEKVTASSQWSGFGYIASEVELKKLK